MSSNEIPMMIQEIHTDVKAIVDLLKKEIFEKIDADDRPLTVEQAAEFLSVSIATIYKKVAGNEIPYMKKGGRLYFTKPELIKYLKEGRIMSNAEILAEVNRGGFTKKGGLHGR